MLLMPSVEILNGFLLECFLNLVDGCVLTIWLPLFILVVKFCCFICMGILFSCVVLSFTLVKDYDFGVELL